MQCSKKSWCVSFLSYIILLSVFPNLYRPIIRNSSLNSFVYVQWRWLRKTMFFVKLPTFLRPPQPNRHILPLGGHACGEVLLLGTHGIGDVEWCTRTWTWSAVVQTQGAGGRFYLRKRGGKGDWQKGRRRWVRYCRYRKLWKAHQIFWILTFSFCSRLFCLFLETGFDDPGKSRVQCGGSGLIWPQESWIDYPA